MATKVQALKRDWRIHWFMVARMIAAIVVMLIFAIAVILMYRAEPVSGLDQPAVPLPPVSKPLAPSPTQIVVTPAPRD